MSELLLAALIATLLVSGWSWAGHEYLTTRRLHRSRMERACPSKAPPVRRRTTSTTGADPAHVRGSR